MPAEKEIALMKLRMDSMEKKIDKIDAKMDMIMNRLLDPDIGVAAKVNKNTAARKSLSKAIWVLYGIIAGAVIKYFFFK